MNYKDNKIFKNLIEEGRCMINKTPLIINSSADKLDQSRVINKLNEVIMLSQEDSKKMQDTIDRLKKEGRMPSFEKLMEAMSSAAKKVADSK